MQRWILMLLAISGAVLAGRSAGAQGEDSPAARELPPAAMRTVDFARDVQPILARSCYSCHGPDKQVSGLRLDVKADALRGGDSGAWFEQGKSAESLLIRYVAGLDPDVVMPPKGDRLTAAEIGILRAWIDQGLAWEDAGGPSRRTSNHWSFQPVVRPSVPAVRRAEWVRNPIDAFILARQEREGLEPSPEADKATLIRRLHLDLLGLPPSPEAVEAFVQDDRTDAYERLVDTLLDSPQFGERWGRHWLDQARYADSDGYEKDSPRPWAYRYRDWVIDAINRDMPFDEFTIAQIAGDLLPGATLADRVATGFHRNTLTNREGGVDQEEFRVAATVNRLNTIGSVWMGLTVGCAQCHSHKYDPLPQHEYYQMFAFLNSIQERDIPAPDPAEQARYELARSAFEAEHAQVVAPRTAFEADELPSRLAAWEAGFKPANVEWTVLRPTRAVSEAGARLAVEDDGAVLAAGTDPDKDSYTIEAQVRLDRLTALRLEALADERLPSKGPGRTPHGNFVVTELEVRQIAESGETTALALEDPSADFHQGAPSEPKQFYPKDVYDGRHDTGWAIAPRMGQNHVAVFQFHEPAAARDGVVRLTIRIDQKYGGRHTLGKLRLSVTNAPRPVTVDGTPEEVLAALRTPREERSRAQQARLLDFYKRIDPEWRKLNDAVEQHARRAPSPPATLAQAVDELPQPRATHVMIRGDFLRPGAAVNPGTPAVLPPLEAGSAPTASGNAAPATRLDFARWLVRADHPLTPRVTVNQWWQHLFGRALVATVEDFGTQGEQPSHPELLDWLASELVARGWRRKAMVKLIVESAAYRQSSALVGPSVERDPRNILVARQGRYRLEAEVIRDSALAASGLLHAPLGGPSVRPPLPEGVAELGYAGSIRWPESSAPDRYRRGMYIFYQRTVPYPMLSTFDAPDSNNACVRRERSNTPLQALTLLNDPVFVECAQALGARVLFEETTQARVVRAFRHCVGRMPTARETERLTAVYEQFRALAGRDPESAARLAGTRKPASADPADAAASVAVARLLLNLDEFLMRE